MNLPNNSASPSRTRLLPLRSAGCPEANVQYRGLGDPSGPKAPGTLTWRASPRCFFSTALIEDSADEGSAELDSAESLRKATEPYRPPLGRLQVAYDADKGQRHVKVDSSKNTSTQEEQQQQQRKTPSLESLRSYEELLRLSEAPPSNRQVITPHIGSFDRQHNPEVPAGKKDAEAIPGYSVRHLAGIAPCCPPGPGQEASLKELPHKPSGVEGHLPPEASQRPSNLCCTGFSYAGDERSARGASDSVAGAPQHLMSSTESHSCKMSLEKYWEAFRGPRTPAEAAKLYPQRTVSASATSQLYRTASASARAAPCPQNYTMELSLGLCPPYYPQQQHVGLPLTPLYRKMTPRLHAPGYPLAKPYWVPNPWMPQHQGYPPGFYMAGPSFSPMGPPAPVPPQSVHGQLRSVSLTSTRGYSLVGAARSTRSSPEQSKGSQNMGCPGIQCPQTTEQQPVQHSLEQQQKQQQHPKALEHSVVGGRVEPAHSPLGNFQHFDKSTNVSVFRESLCSSSCSRASQGSKASLKPQAPPACSTEGHKEDRGDPCQRPPVAIPQDPLDFVGSQEQREPEASSYQDGTFSAHTPSISCNSDTQAFEFVAAEAEESAAPAQYCIASAPVSTTESSKSTTETHSFLRSTNRRPLQEPPAAIGSRILRHLQTLKGILRDQASFEETPVAQEDRSSPEAPSLPSSIPQKTCANGSLSEPGGASTGAPRMTDREAPPQKKSFESRTGSSSEGSVPEEPSCPTGDVVPTSAAVPLGGALSSHERGHSLVAAGVPRLTLAVLNGGAGGPGGNGSSGPPPRRAPSSVFQAPMRPPSPEPCQPLAERPHRGPPRRGSPDRCRDKVEGEAPRKVESSSSQTTGSEDAAVSKDGPKKVSVSHAYDADFEPMEAQKCKPNTSLTLSSNRARAAMHEHRDSVHSQSASAAFESQDALPSEGIHLPSVTSKESNQLTQTPPPQHNPPQGSAQGTVEESFVRNPAPAADDGGTRTHKGGRKDARAPTFLCTPHNLQRLHVRWALWSLPSSPGNGLAEGVGVLQEGSPPASPRADTEQNNVVVYPSVDDGLRGCRACKIDFFIARSPPQVKATEDPSRGLAVCK